MNNFKVIYLTEDVNRDAILKILTLDNKLVNSGPVYDYYKKLAIWADGRKLKEKNINLDTLKLSDRSLIGDGTNGIPKKANSLLRLLNALESKLGKNYNPANETPKKVQQLTLEILAGLSGLKESPKPIENSKEFVDEDPKEETPKDPEKSTTNWTAEKARRLEQAKAAGKTTSEVLNKFYEDYYSIEYAGVKTPTEDTYGIVDKLKSLNEILIPEFNKLGYNPSVNPLAQFLKILIKLKKEKGSNIFDKLTTNTYGAIHNSFIEKHITGNMLGNYDTKNILFCTDLYNYKGLDIVNYLSLQKQTINSAKSKSEYADNPGLVVAKIFIQQASLSDDYKKNLDKLVNDPNKDEMQIILPSAENAKMRSELEISEIYHHLFKAIPKKDVTGNTAKDIVAAAEEANILLAMVRYLLNMNRLVDEEEKDYESWFKKFSYTPNDDNIETSKEVLSRYIITDKAVNLILKKLRARLEELLNKKAGNKN